MDKNTSLIITTAWAVLTIIGRLLLLRKAGKPGWHSIIPILNVYDEFSICWNGGKIFLLALLFAAVGGFSVAAQNEPLFFIGTVVAGLWIVIIHWKQSMKLARSFGKGGMYGLFLFLFDKFGRVVLGLSAAEYVGKE